MIGRATPQAIRDAITFTAADALAPAEWIARALLTLSAAADEVERLQRERDELPEPEPVA